MKWIMYFLLPTFGWATCKSLDFKSMQPVEPQFFVKDDDLYYPATRRKMYYVVCELNLMFTAKRAEALKANDAKKLPGIGKEYKLKQTALNETIEELVKVEGNLCEDRSVCLSENISFEITKAERILEKEAVISKALRANALKYYRATQASVPEHTEPETFCFKESKNWAKKVCVDKLLVSAIIYVTKKWQVGTTNIALNETDPEVC